MAEQLNLDGQPVVKRIKLDCYLVGDHDYYAAASAEEAKQLHNDLCDVDEDDVCLVVGQLLDKEWVDEDSREPVGTLRQFLAQATEPGWLAGTE
jgi:hypothetical protein